MRKACHTLHSARFVNVLSVNLCDAVQVNHRSVAPKSGSELLNVRCSPKCRPCGRHAYATLGVLFKSIMALGEHITVSVPSADLHRSRSKQLPLHRGRRAGRGRLQRGLGRGPGGHCSSHSVPAVRSRRAHNCGRNGQHSLEPRRRWWRRPERCLHRWCWRTSYHCSRHGPYPPLLYNSQ